jgi:hypothetical protein
MNRTLSVPREQRVPGTDGASWISADEQPRPTGELERETLVGVMRRGEVVESGSARDVLLAPRADYTRELVAAVPRIRARASA